MLLEGGGKLYTRAEASPAPTIRDCEAVSLSIVGTYHCGLPLDAMLLYTDLYFGLDLDWNAEGEFSHANCRAGVLPRFFSVQFDDQV
jgi:hypothetical protein